jgi:hypothetical protein
MAARWAHAVNGSTVAQSCFSRSAVLPVFRSGRPDRPVGALAPCEALLFVEAGFSPALRQQQAVPA